jgi:hypothetical protein
VIDNDVGFGCNVESGNDESVGLEMRVSPLEQPGSCHESLSDTDCRQIDFEMSTIDTDEGEMNTEMREVKNLLASLTGKR